MWSLLICTPHQIFLGNKIEKNVMAGNVACMGDKRGAYRVLVGKPEGRTSRCRWEDNIKKWNMGART